MSKGQAIQDASTAGVPLGDVVEVIRGVSYKKEDATGSPGPDRLPILRATNIQAGLAFDELVYVPRRYVSERQMLRLGDIVLAASSGSRSVVGKAAPLVSDWEGSFGAFCFALRPKVGVEPRYLAWFLQTPGYRGTVSELSAGVNINNLRASHLQGIRIPLVPMEKQRAVVARLEKQMGWSDEAGASLLRVQANLKRYRAAVLKAACEGRLVPTEAELARQAGRPGDFESGSALLARILEERRRSWKGKGKYKEPAGPVVAGLGELPPGWTYAAVEALGGVQLGRQRAPKHHTGNNMRPYLRVANVYEDHLDLADIKKMNFTPAEFEIFRLDPGDILLNDGQSLELVGRPAIYRGELPGSCFTNTLVRFRPSSALDVRFALTAFRSFLHSGRFRRIARWTTNIAHLGADRFAKMAFPLPPLAEQRRIVAEVERRLSVVTELEATVETNLRRGASLRQAILQRAFSGAGQTPHD